MRRQITSLLEFGAVPQSQLTFSSAFTVTKSGDLSLPNEAADIITQIEPLKRRIFIDNSNQCHYAYIVVLALEWVSQLEMFDH